jgi:hypothetical protein
MRIATRPVRPAGGNRVRRSTVVKLALGALALAGIGAGMTSAAWTDDANFLANANSASVSLYAYKLGDTGCTTAPTTGGTTGCWIDATSAAPVSIPASAFAGLLPTNTKVYTAYLYNAGTANLALTTAVASKTGIFADGTSPATITVGTYHDVTANADLTATAVLPSLHLASVAVTIAPGANWATMQSTYAGKPGTATLTFQGTAQ